MSPAPTVTAPPTGADVVVAPRARKAVPEVLASVTGTASLLVRGRLHNPRVRVGARIAFADGSTSRVYRETTVGDGRAQDPAVLVVSFVLRRVRGRLSHAAFRVESWLNTPMFVGFPGFTSKLWMTADDHGVYRGVYEWDGAGPAAHYVQALSWVLNIVSVPGSVRAHIEPGLRRDDVLARPDLLEHRAGGRGQWWRPIACMAR